MVSPENLLGESVAVKAFGSQKAIKLPVASVPFKVGELEWVERVAVAPIQEGVECEVLYGIDLRSERGLKLVLLINQTSQESVCRVVTRAEASKEKAEEEQEALVNAQEGPTVKACEVSRQAVAVDKEVTVDKDLVCQKEGDAEKEDGNECLGGKVEEAELNLGIELDTSVEGVEMC